MIDTTTELIIGIAFGLVVGIGPAIAVGALGAACSDRGSKLPRSASVAIGVALAGLNGYAVGVLDPVAVRTQFPRLGTGTLVVALLSISATSQGERVASELPFGAGRPTVRKQSLSAAAIDAVDAMGQVTIRSSGGIRNIDGYPPLSPGLQTALESDAWRLPADLPLAALETRLAARLRTEYDLAAVSVSIDGRGRATVAAAPPNGNVATAVPDGWRAVSVATLIPAGLAPGEEIRASTRDESVAGIVLQVDQHGRSEQTRPTAEATGGEGRVTVAVPAADADPIFAAARVRIAVPTSDPDADRQALARLERAEYSVRRTSFGAVASVVEPTDDGSTEPLRVLAASPCRDTADNGQGLPTATTAAELDSWRLDPEPASLDERDEVFVAGPRTAVRRHVDDERGLGSRSSVTTALEGAVKP